MISQDFRSRAFLLYFSRPLTKVQYIAGKAATISLYLLCVTMFPALLLYLVGVLLSPDISVLYATWDLPLRDPGVTHDCHPLHGTVINAVVTDDGIPLRFVCLVCHLDFRASDVRRDSQCRKSRRQFHGAVPVIV